jgi:hypothetical protein
MPPSTHGDQARYLPTAGSMYGPGPTNSLGMSSTGKSTSFIAWGLSPGLGSPARAIFPHLQSSMQCAACIGRIDGSASRSARPASGHGSAEVGNKWTSGCAGENRRSSFRRWPAAGPENPSQPRGEFSSPAFSLPGFTEKGRLSLRSIAAPCATPLKSTLNRAFSNLSPSCAASSGSDDFLSATHRWQASALRKKCRLSLVPAIGCP